MALFYKLKTENKIFDNLEDLDTVISIMKKYNLSTDTVTIDKCVSKNINSIIEGLMKSSYTMEELRNNNRKEHNLKQFNSQFMYKDSELPYDFDLLFDIKCEGNIAYLLQRDGFITQDLEELCLDYGYTTEYLQSLELRSK